MKISKQLIFTSTELLNYLKTVKKFTKLDEEILVVVTYKKVYEKITGKRTLVAFPYRDNRENELLKKPLLAVEYGQYIRLCIDEDSLIDSMLVDPKDFKTVKYRPLQVKYLGKGEFKVVTVEKFINFLRKYQKYNKNEITLLIALDGPVRINRLEEISSWLRENEFPFKEIVLINADNKTGDMVFYQLKPSIDKLLSIIIPKSEMLNELH